MNFKLQSHVFPNYLGATVKINSQDTLFSVTDTYEEQKYSHIEFSLNNTEIRSTVQWWGFGVPSLNKISVLNQPPIKMVAINDQPCVKPCEFTYNTQTKVLQITANLSLDKPFNVKWYQTMKPPSPNWRNWMGSKNNP